MHCNGCGVDVQTDQGMAEKLQRLEKIQVYTVHVGVCTIVGKTPQERHLCPTIEKLTEMLSEKGIRVVFGTH
jgi:predicted metal-binding protein